MKKNWILKPAVVAGALTAMVFVGGCTTTTAPSQGQTTGVGDIAPLIIFLVLIFGFMYFGVIRPQRRRQKEHQQMVTGLKKGDKVITAGGIFGVIENISEDSVVIKVESGTMLRVAKGSVAVRRE